MTSHSTATFNSLLRTVSTLLTVFTAFAEVLLEALHVFIADRVQALLPRNGTRCTRNTISFCAIPEGFWRFAVRSCPETWS